MSDQTKAATTSQAAKWTMRDHDRHAQEAMMRHSGEMRRLELARIAALALVEEFPDMVNHYDMALAVVRALDEDGIVFARMSLLENGSDREARS